MMELLKKDEFFAQAESQPQHEDVPIGDRHLRIGAITAAGRDVFLGEMQAGAPLSVFQARLVAATAIDDAGALVFTAADVENLVRLPSVTLNRLAEVAARLNGIGPTALEDAEKNSVAAQSGASPSASPSSLAAP